MIESLFQLALGKKTPLIIYDRDFITDKLKFLRQISDQHGCIFLFPVKSFPHLELIKHISHYVHGFEISNVNELDLLPTGFFPDYLAITDPTIQVENIELFSRRANKIFYSLDSISEKIFEQLRPFKGEVEFMLRLSHTDLDLPITGSNNHVHPSRFGSHLDHLSSSDQNMFAGVHIHNGSDKNLVQDYIWTAHKILDKMYEIQTDFKYINLGGGFSRLSKNQMLVLLKELRNILPSQCTIIIEPGKFVSVDSGVAFAQIKFIKQITSVRYAVTTDLSYECHLKWSDPEYVYEQQNSDKMVTVDFYGPTCYENDLITSVCLSCDHVSEKLRVSEWVAFKGISGYSFAWNHSFNGIPMAEIYFVDQLYPYVA